ncbi:MAG: PBP1A family penicillin-binding protein [Acidobacteria bacterium]|nr:PBP1A family penicillin-binding protein [Acidobacteriota bacterium]
MQYPEHKKSTRSKHPPKAWVKTRRVGTYKKPPRSRFRRVLGWFFNAWTFSLAGILLVTAFLTLTYFWFQFSDDIDRRLLSGEVFTPSAGIYSAPKTLRAGERISLPELIEYLRSAGYIQKSDKADPARSRYSVSSRNLLIEPGYTAVIDGEKAFPDLSVSFNEDGKSVNTILDLGLGAERATALLEPKMLSTIAREGDGRRKTVNFADLPPHLIKAITVTEDRAFFEHWGVNFRGIARAVWQRYDGEENSPLANQGGSSITQQLVKNLLLTNEATYKRKLTEAYMSVILETRLSKEEIFTLYANQVYLGQQTGVSIYGVGEAASAYFGKDVSQLSLPEAAFLAGILRSPNRYNPYKNTERVEERRNQILDSMLEAEAITPREHAEARAVKLELKEVSARDDLQGMPYFSQHIVDELPKIISDPEALQHLRVYTSIDPDLQRIAYQTVASRLEKLEKYYKKKEPGNLNAALVAIRPKTGEIVAMVGGRNYQQNQFNRATSAMRQPGSVFKPFVYAAAINSAYEPASRIFTAATVLKDEKKIFTSGRDSYAPNNYGDYFSNQEITLRDALVKSKNTVTVDLAMQVNVGRIMNLAARAGMPKVEKAYPSMALGTAEATPLQVATAYTAFANLGDRVMPRPITKITRGDGSTRVASVPDRQTVIRPDVAYIMNDIMKDIVNRGTAAQLRGWGFKNDPGKVAVAGKTGTSRDGWFAGFTPELVTVVYVGFDNNDDLGMTGSESAMPIWADFMKEALSLHPEWNGDWMMPSGIRKAEIDIRNGALVRELDGSESVSVSATPTATPTPEDVEPEDPDWAVEEMPEKVEIYVTEVPPQFRRTELFISGTIPNRKLLDEEEIERLATDSDPQGTNKIEPWVENVEGSPPPLPPKSGQANDSKAKALENIVVSICPQSGQKSKDSCPIKRMATFGSGLEPRFYCNIH